MGNYLRAEQVFEEIVCVYQVEGLVEAESSHESVFVKFDAPLEKFVFNVLVMSEVFEYLVLVGQFHKRKTLVSVVLWLTGTRVF